MTNQPKKPLSERLLVAVRDHYLLDGLQVRTWATEVAALERQLAEKDAQLAAMREAGEALAEHTEKASSCDTCVVCQRGRKLLAAWRKAAGEKP